MAVSEVTICNMALSHIRAGSINALNEGSLQAQQCNLWFDILRDRTLADAPWQFAESIKPLSPRTDEVFGWTYVYQYPSDCLRINRLIRNFSAVESRQPGQSDVSSRLYDPLMTQPNLDHPIEYRVMNLDGNKVVVSNEPNLRIDYNKKVADVNLFDNDFIMALSHLIASNVSMSVVAGELGRQMKVDNLQLYSSYIDSALANNGNEQYHTPVDSEYVTVRS